MLKQMTLMNDEQITNLFIRHTMKLISNELERICDNNEIEIVCIQEKQDIQNHNEFK